MKFLLNIFDNVLEFKPNAVINVKGTDFYHFI